MTKLSVSQMTAPDLPRPIPHASRLSERFWQGCKEGQLLYQAGAGDDRAIFPPQAFSPYDMGAELEWRTSSGRGTVYSYTVIWRPQTPAFRTPYVAAIVELEEGYTMLTNIIGCEPDEIEIGMPVVVVFEDVEGDVVLPFFRPGTKTVPLEAFVEAGGMENK